MNIIIFNSLLLPPSQTFIRDPAEKLQEFTAYYVGSRRVQGLELPPERTMVVNPGDGLGKVKEQIFKLTGVAPPLYARIKRLNPVLIHAQFGLSGVLVLPWVRSLRIPLIVHYRGADATVTEESSRYTSLNHWLYFQRKAQLQREATLFLTVSEFIKNQLLEQGFPEGKIQVHYHGVDVNYFTPDPSIEREPVILFVGRLTAKKGLEYLIDAIAALQSQNQESKLVIIGDGELKAKLEKLAKQKLKNYDFLGVQPLEVVKTWMNKAQLLVSPSITSEQGDSEGLPNVIQEAQAMGLPVVSTFHAGIPEAVLHEETGLLTPEKDVKKLTEYIKILLDNHNIRQQFSQAGRQRMETYFNRAKQTQKLEETYLSVMEG